MFDDTAVILALGTVAATALYFVARATQSSGKSAGPVLDAREYRDFPLIERIDVNHNTRIFRFGLPKPQDTLDLPTGQHLQFRAPCGDDGKSLMRAYTPVEASKPGQFDLLVKVYEQGKMTQYLEQMKVGDTIQVRGPKGRFVHDAASAEYQTAVMTAGGTGLTPMYQIIKDVLGNPSDPTKLALVFANVTEDDILLREELEELAESHPDQFSLLFTLDRPGDGWTGGSGFINPDMIKQTVEKLGANTGAIKALTCGPPPMVKAQERNYEALGYTDVYLF